MQKLMLAALAAAVLVPAPLQAQTFSARRMAMGGVVLAGAGPGADAANVAYRAVPAAAPGPTSLSLPLGLVPFLAHLPTFDPNDPRFNVYELANDLYNPPWNLQLSSPPAPSNDITVEIARNSLAIDLGDVADVFPHDHSVLGATINGPAYTFAFRPLPLFVGAGPLVEYDNDLRLDPALDHALHGGAFAPNTTYGLTDRGQAQAAAGVQLGWAQSVLGAGDPRKGGSALYAGMRVKLMRGLAYGSADNALSFATSDTLFGTSPIAVHYDATLRDAGPDGGGFGRGLDLGAVWVAGGMEFGLGVNDIGTRIDWKVRESVVSRDSVTGQTVQQVIDPSAAFTSTVPVTVTANALVPVGPWTLAADVQRDVNATLGHAGIERWLGLWALRAGGSVDANRMVQGSLGTGVRFGRIGLDLALASHSRNVTRARALELGAGVSLYHAEAR